MYGKYAYYRTLRFRYNHRLYVDRLLETDTAFAEIINFAKQLCAEIEYDWGAYGRTLFFDLTWFGDEHINSENGQIVKLADYNRENITFLNTFSAIQMSANEHTYLRLK